MRPRPEHTVAGMALLIASVMLLVIGLINLIMDAGLWIGKLG